MVSFLRAAVATLLVAGAFGWGSPANAGAWTQPRHELWLKINVIGQSSDRFYARDQAVLPDGTRVEAGDERPFDDGGRARQTQLWMEAEWGATDRLTVGAQFPWKWLNYEDRVQTIESWGWGDARVSARYALLTGTSRLSARMAYKASNGRFTDDVDRLPIGDNQTDVELGLQFGRSLGRPLSWIGVEAGRRWRQLDEEIDFDPEDEWFWLTEAGWALDDRGRVGLKLAWSGSSGSDEGVNFFAPGASLSRDFQQVDAVLMIDARYVFVELGAARTLASESYPTGVMFSLGLSQRVGLR